MPAAAGGAGPRPLLVAFAFHFFTQLAAGVVVVDQRARSRVADSHHYPAAQNSLRGPAAASQAPSDVPPLTPDQFLIVSSPAESKIVFTHVTNFKSDSGVPKALVDSGLSRPRGLAIDHAHGYLYVADAGSSRVLRYRLILQADQVDAKRSLTTDGVQLVIVQDHEVDWVSCDINGDLFFSDKNKKFIGHLPYDTIDMIAKGEAEAASLEVVNQTELEKESEAKESSLEAALKSNDSTPLEPTTPKAQLLTIYEANATQNVHAPSGIVSDGIRVYWGNELGGAKYGSVVRGEANPQAVQTSSGQTDQGAGDADGFKFQVTSLASTVNTTYGLAKSSKLVLFSSDGGANASSSRGGFVYGVADTLGGNAAVYALASTLVAPRGLCWDGDQTVYVADEGADAVYSMPVGRLADNVPLELSMKMDGPFGVALLSASDPAWAAAGAAGSGPGVVGWVARLGAMVAVAASTLAAPA